MMNIYSPLEQFQVNSILGFNLGWFDISITNSTISVYMSSICYLAVPQYAKIPVVNTSHDSYSQQTEMQKHCWTP